MKRTVYLMSFQELAATLQEKVGAWSELLFPRLSPNGQAEQDLFERFKDTWWLVALPLAVPLDFNQIRYAADSLQDALRRYPRTPFSSRSALLWSNQQDIDPSDLWEYQEDWDIASPAYLTE